MWHSRFEEGRYRIQLAQKMTVSYYYLSSTYLVYVSPHGPHHESSSQLFRYIAVHAYLSLPSSETNIHPLIKFGILVFDLEEATIVDTAKPDHTLIVY